MAEEAVVLQLRSPAVTSCEDGIARWRADRRRGVRVDKQDYLTGESVDVRRLDLGCSITAEITIAEIDSFGPAHHWPARRRRSVQHRSLNRGNCVYS